MKTFKAENIGRFIALTCILEHSQGRTLQGSHTHATIPNGRYCRIECTYIHIRKSYSEDNAKCKFTYIHMQTSQQEHIARYNALHTHENFVNIGHCRVYITYIHTRTSQMERIARLNALTCTCEHSKGKTFQCLMHGHTHENIP